MRFLFLKRSLRWPRSAGHDVHTFEMARALAELGHEIGLATVERPVDESLIGLPLEVGLHSLRSGGCEPRERQNPIGSSGAHGADAPRSEIKLAYLQRRFLRYWGIDSAWVVGAARVADKVRPDVVVAAGLEMLPCLAAIRGPVRVWYAADEYATHHLSMVTWSSARTWRRLADAAIAALYERSYAGAYDRAWVVSAAEARAIRLIGGARAADVAPNGVDGDRFRPGSEPKRSRSCAFWGRLDAGPNIQAVAWFSRRVWPALRRDFPDAVFRIAGFAPTVAVRALAGNGIEIVADAPDIRPEVRPCEAAVMPFVSGGGIKNKLLEAAAMGMPIVASPSGCVGLDARGGLPLIVARRPAEWVRALSEIWTDPTRREKLGTAAREWVLARHTWIAAARAVLAGLSADFSPLPTLRERGGSSRLGGA